jgi:ADP-heptose:LPS heptosyltransferase
VKLNFRRGGAFASKYAKRYLATKDPEDFKAITVIRHAAIGDWVGVRPFLIELRRFFPNAKITLSVTRAYMYGMPEDLVDKIHIVDKEDPERKGKKTNLFYRIKKAKELPPQDLIFDLTDSALSLTLVLFIKSKLKIGFPYRISRRFFYDMATLRSDFALETESILQQLYMFGAKPEKPLNYGYKTIYPKKLEKRMIYFAGASVQTKCWEEHKFSLLIQKMVKRYPKYTHIILQGIKDDEKFLTIYNEVKNHPNVQLQVPMTLDEIMQFLANSSCVISNDTGIRNMALSVDTPTVGIFFSTIPYRYWPGDGRHDFIFNPNHTSPEVEEVFDVTTTLLNKLY